MAKEWYVKTVDDEYGPLSSLQLKQLAEHGRITGNSRVRLGRKGQWIRASKVKGLFPSRGARTADDASHPHELANSPRPEAPPPHHDNEGISGQEEAALSSFLSEISEHDQPFRRTSVPAQESTPPVNEQAEDEGQPTLRISRRQIAIITGAALAPCVLVVLVYAGVQVFGGSDSNVSLPHMINVSEELSTEQIVSRTEDSIALVRGKNSTGTGFLVDDDMLVTNAHVIRSELIDNLEIYFPSAEQKNQGPFSARLLYEDVKRDLAFMAIEVPQQPLDIADSYSFRRGQEITVIGNPGVGNKLVLENAVSRGVVSTKTEIDGQEFYQIGISINSGNSGGPVIDSTGHVIGVVTLKAAEEEGIAFCIPLEDVRAAMAKVDSQTPEDQRALASRHQLRTAFRLIKTAGDIYAAAMEAYSSSMGTAIDGGLSASDGLRMASNEIDVIVAALDKVLVGELKTVVSGLASDPKIPESTRQKLVDLWTNYKEMKSYVDEPRGSYNSYRQKTLELTDKHNRLAEALGLLLGVNDG